VQSKGKKKSRQTHQTTSGNAESSKVHDAIPPPQDPNAAHLNNPYYLKSESRPPILHDDVDSIPIVQLEGLSHESESDGDAESSSAETNNPPQPAVEAPAPAWESTTAAWSEEPGAWSGSTAQAAPKFLDADVAPSTPETFKVTKAKKKTKAGKRRKADDNDVT